jgi:integrase/recombinase XerD
VTRLRRMMLDELQRRNYSEITTRKYLRAVTDFAKHFGKSPDRLGPNELRTYQAYLLKERNLTPGSAVNCVAALPFFFVKTLRLPGISLSAPMLCIDISRILAGATHS